MPWRETKNLFHALIAELMLQRTKAEQVLDVYTQFVSRYPSVEEAKSEDEDILKNTLSPLGLNWRIANIIQLINELSNIKTIPTSFDGLVQLSGVGSYIANAMLSFHFGEKSTIIDSNVVRLWGRVFGFETDGETRRKKWFKELAENITPDESFRDFNYAILDFTNAICKPKPLCSQCPLNPICAYKGKEKNG